MITKNKPQKYQGFLDVSEKQIDDPASRNMGSLSTSRPIFHTLRFFDDGSSLYPSSASRF